LRLASQLLSPHQLKTPAEVVAWMGAVQAQDFGASRWAVGVRLPGTTEAEVALAISKGSVLRTHLFRGTWQLVAREDLRWMLALVAPRLLGGRSGRERELGLDAATFRRSRTALARALAEGEHRTRGELGAVLERAGIPAQGPRLSHLLQRAELEGLVCSGALHRGVPTYALLDARAPAWRAPPDRAESLRELAIRHARGRGPATAADLAAWAGITMADARAGLEEARPLLLPETVGGQVHWRWARGAGAPRPAVLHLLPAFDEYLVGYRDRSAMLEEGRAARLVTRNGIFSPCVVARGRVIGLWRRGLARGSAELELELFESEPSSPPRGAAEAARRYGEFLGVAARASQRPSRSGVTLLGPPPAG
jgi:hypothetical protein